MYIIKINFLSNLFSDTLLFINDYPRTVGEAGSTGLVLFYRRGHQKSEGLNDYAKPHSVVQIYIGDPWLPEVVLSSPLQYLSYKRTTPTGVIILKDDSKVISKKLQENVNNFLFKKQYSVI